MRVGIFSDSINIPPKEGINVHTYRLACALARQKDTEVLLTVCDRGWLDLDILREQPFDTLVLPSEQFYDTAYISTLISDYSLSILQTYMVYFAAVVLGPASTKTQVPLCVEFHDLERTIVPFYLEDEVKIAYHDKLQYRAGMFASLVRIMSAHDYNAVQDMWPDVAAHSVWMPVAIDKPRFKETVRTKSLLFIGNTSYPPNERAAHFIAETLAPKLSSQHISLVGRGSERFEAKNITAHGMVDDINPILASHTLGLAPITEGSGMKIKLLDYLSAGLPVITTTLGAHGYPASDAITIEDDFDKWPRIIEQMLSNEAELNRRSHAAEALFHEHFDLDTTITKLLEQYAKLQFSQAEICHDFEPIEPRQSDIYWLNEVRETPRPSVSEAFYAHGNASC